MGLKPKRVEHDFVYFCPKCNAETWRSMREVQIIDKGVCECGQILDFDLIECIKGKVVYKKEAKAAPKAVPVAVVAPVAPKKADLVEFEPAIDALMGLGFKKPEAVKKIKRALHDGAFGGDMDEFIKHLVTTQV